MRILRGRRDRKLPNKRLKLPGALALRNPLCRALAGTGLSSTTSCAGQGAARSLSAIR